MLSRVIRFLLCVCILGGCSSSPVLKYTCPYGVPILTEKDFDTMQDVDKISDVFVDWLLKTGLYCEKNGLE